MPQVPWFDGWGYSSCDMATTFGGKVYDVYACGCLSVTCELAVVNVLKIIYLRAIGSGRAVHYQNLLVLIVPFRIDKYRCISGYKKQGCACLIWTKIVEDLGEDFDESIG